MIFSPGNWQSAARVNAVGQKLTGGQENVVNQFVRPILSAIPGNLDQIGQRLEYGGDEDVGKDIVLNTLGLGSMAGLPTRPLALAVNALVPSKRGRED
jgi:hypothetical protein